MKVFIRNLKVAGQSSQSQIDFLDLTKYVYSEITKIDVSIDLTESQSQTESVALFNNVTTEQRITVGGVGFKVAEGYYTLPDLMSVLNKNGTAVSLITTEENAYHCAAITSLDFSRAKELQEILGFENDYVDEGSVSEHPCDITRGMNVIQFFSSVVNSDSETPICSIKIDDPTCDFHQTINTKIALSANVLNYIDIALRDIHGNNIVLNCDISITLFINCYEEFDQLKTDQTDSELSRFNLTSVINKLENGKHTEYISHPISCNNSKVVNANFLVSGKIKNLSSDQSFVIDGERFSIPAGCYNLELLLAHLNSKSAAVFSYIKNGENAFHVQVSNVSVLTFETEELANMLGFNVGTIKVGDVTLENVKYQLTDDCNTFIVSDGSVTRTLTCPTGLYNEDEFFNVLLNVIKQDVSGCAIEKTNMYYKFNKITSISGDISKYYWCQNLNRRKQSDTNIIPRVGCFYYNCDITVKSIQETCIVNNGNHGGLKTFNVYFSDGTTRNGHVQNAGTTVEEHVKNNVKKFGLDTYFDITYYKNTAHFVSKNGVGVRFVCTSKRILDVFHYPTKFSTDFYLYVTNDEYKYRRVNFSGQTLIFYHQENNNHEVVYTITGSKFMQQLLNDFRSPINNYLNEYFGTTGLNAFLVYSCPIDSNIQGNSETILFNHRDHHVKFGGTAITEGLIKGLPTEYVSNPSGDVYFDYSNCTHNVNLGYVNMSGLYDGIEKMLKINECFEATNPSYNMIFDKDRIIIDNPNGLICLEQSELPSDQEYDPVATMQPCRSILYTPDHIYKVTTNNNTFIIDDVTYTIPTGMYTYDKIIIELNNRIKGYVFVRTTTYYELVHRGVNVDGTLFDLVPFQMLSSSVRLYYPDHKVIDNFSISSLYPMNITNGFNLINVFSNLIETDTNNDNYLSSFIITTTDGINISNAGVKSNFSNSNESIDRYIGDSNVNTLEYYFTRENGEPFNIDGQIIVGLEVEQS